MLATTAASTWGVTDAQFLGGYGTLCALCALGVRHERRRLLGPVPTSLDPQPDLDAPRLALLSGGPDHAITVAAAELLRDGRLRGDGVTISANGEPAATADALEREVFEAVRREPGLSIEEMHAHVRGSATMTAMTEEMTRSGLLVGGADAARMRLLWIVPGLLAGIGFARILTGVDDDATVAALFALVMVAVVATVRLVGNRPLATNCGRSVLERRRSDSAPKRLYPAASEIGLMTALFGGGALWVADPVTASALHVPREKEPSPGGGGLVGGGGGGGCGGGGGWSGDGGCGGGGGGGDGGGGGGGCGGGGG